MDDMLTGGAAWAVKQGYGIDEDLDHIEEHGKMQGAKPEYVSSHAKKRQKNEMGTLGSGNHYLEVQEVVDIFDEKAASFLGLRKGQIVISIHCGSRGLGHQIGTEFLKEMVIAAPHHNINLPDRELACAPIQSELGQRYLGAMRAGINCALANRQIITHLLRKVFHDFYPREPLKLLYDVSHNTCKVEEHFVKGQKRTLYIHRKGATRAFGPGHPGLKEPFKTTGQPVMIGGTMGTTSYILLGTSQAEDLSFSSSCHGAGRAMSRHQAKKQYFGRQLVDELADRGIIIKSPTMRGVAEEAPLAYKDVTAVIECAHQAGLSKKIAKLNPIICVKG
jgi:tRNA-splicing ligase RtcB